MTSDDRILEAARRSMESSAQRARQELKRWLNGLATIGATAPFVGLFGTVIGIVNCFQGFSGTPVGFLSSTAGGISEALVTTRSRLARCGACRVGLQLLQHADGIVRQGDHGIHRRNFDLSIGIPENVQIDVSVVHFSRLLIHFEVTSANSFRMSASVFPDFFGT